LQHSYTMFLSKLTPGAAKPLRKFSLRGSVQPPTLDRLASAWFRILSALQAKPRCPLDGSAPCVPSSPSAVDVASQSGFTAWYVRQET
jgi:hypothetical protein